MGTQYEVLVERGVDIREAVAAFVLENGLKNVYVSGAVGSAHGFSLTTPENNNFPMEIQAFSHADVCEIVSLVGEAMTWDLVDPLLKRVYPEPADGLFVHLHVSLATIGGKVIGGGLREGKAFRSVRVFLTDLGPGERRPK
jgi:predicted DNA-binding protein with PD1-like motif